MFVKHFNVKTFVNRKFSTEQILIVPNANVFNNIKKQTSKIKENFTTNNNAVHICNLTYLVQGIKMLNRHVLVREDLANIERNMKTCDVNTEFVTLLTLS